MGMSTDIQRNLDEQIDEMIKLGNNMVLQSSRSAALLASAIFAGVSVWAPQSVQDHGMVRFILALLVVSVVFSALAHLVLGLCYLKTARRSILSNANPDSSQYKYGQEFWIWPSIIMGVVQAICFVGALVFVLWYIFQ